MLLQKWEKLWQDSAPFTHVKGETPANRLNRQGKAVDEQSIFLTALEKSAPSERDAWLREACGTDARLRQQIELLLAKHDDAGSFLEKPPADLALENTEAIAGNDTRNDAFRKDLAISLDFLRSSEVPGSLGRIGTYEVQSVIGRGGMGIVLKAQDTRLNRTVAVKVLAPELAANTTARKRFLREAQAAAAVVHPHVVTIHAVDEDMLPFLVMELVPGISLRDRIEQEGTLPVAEIVSIGSQIAAGLAAAHKQGLIHRDIKPANILLENGVQQVKVTDFGLARAANDLEITQTGELAGTPQYMSPEQARGDALDACSDLFSLGSVLYTMCTGRSPFRAERPFAVIHRVCHEQPQPIHELNQEIPDWLCAIIDRLLSKRPADRFQSAQEVAELLSSPHVSRKELSDSFRRSSLGTHHPEGPPSAESKKSLAPRISPKSKLQNPKSLLIATAAAAGFLLACYGVWVVIKNKQGQEIARIQAPDGSSVTLETDVQPKPAAEGTPIAPPAPEQQPFVIPSVAGTPERQFNSLVEAVKAASDGDIIEVRGNGPFISDQIAVNHALTIRAATGFRPVIKLNPNVSNSRADFITNHAPLVLEGLELWGTRLTAAHEGAWTVIFMALGPLHIANCRIVRNGSQRSIQAVTLLCRIINSEMLVDDADDLVLSPRDGARLVIDNCLIAGPNISVPRVRPDSANIRVQVSRCTWITKYQTFYVSMIPQAGFSDQSRETSAVTFDTARSMIHSQNPLLQFDQLASLAQTPAFPAEQANALLERLVQWRGDRNIYSLTQGYRYFSVDNRRQPGAKPISNLDEWRQLTKSAETGCLEGAVRFQGGDLVGRSVTAPHQLTPDDFRLRPDSAGYRALGGGRDLGAYIDHVGPGPAYERWKNTSDYQQWLDDTRPAK